ncbi:hypothetical protein A2U01_0090365, partial [Trifolium medium]|nr:hypothetical protein [Trifolium medium]
VIHNPIMDAIRADPEALSFHTQRRLQLLKLKRNDHLQFNAVEDFGPFTKNNRIPHPPRRPR